jgi:hypothetical protein
MKLLTILALICLGIYLPIAFLEAMDLQARIDAAADRTRGARLGR